MSNHSAAAAKPRGRLLPLSPYRHPPGCPGRANCLPGLKRAHGLRFMAFVPLDAGRSVALLALAAGYIDVTLRFTTDPGIPAWHLAVLADDRGLQLAANVTPPVRRDVIVGYGRIWSPYSTRCRPSWTPARCVLPTRGLSWRGGNPRLVADGWLRAPGLIPAGVTCVE
jgi:hypothetical protein